MRCIKNCECNKCEMFNDDEVIVEIDKYGLRTETPAYKCLNYAVYSKTPNGLKNSTQMNNLIWK